MAELTVTRQTSARIPTQYGEFELILYTNNIDDKEHLVFAKGDIAQAQPILVRIHSECFTGDVMGSRRCDCGEQLDRAMQLVQEAGVGAILYLRQEGRGIGLIEKLKAYNLQDKGYDTVEANELLGHVPDARDYTIAARILQNLGVSQIRLMTNNPAKVDALTELGINVTERVALQVTTYDDNAAYLLTKAQRMNHMIDVSHLTTPTANGKNGKHD